MDKINYIKTISAILLLSMTAITALTAQSQYIKVDNSIVKKVGDSVVISFDIKLDSLNKLSNNYKLVATPVLSNSNGNSQLRDIVFSSRRKMIVDLRKQAIVPNAHYATQKEIVNYQYRIPFNGWMANSSIYLNLRQEGCCNKKTLDTIVISEDNLQPIIPTINTPVYIRDLKFDYENNVNSKFTFVHPMSSEEAIDIADNRDRGLAIYFKQGSKDINPSYENNKISLDKIVEAVDFIKADPNLTLSKITILGASSPDGRYKFNLNLAKYRAEDLISYLSYPDKNIFEVHNIGEDWVGLCNLIEKSSMPSKEEVLKIINRYSIFNGREKKLMDLARGVPYKYMKEHFFPKLRSASYLQIFYKVALTDSLTSEQMAIDLMTQGYYEEALELLSTVENTPSILNLKGVCYMMTGDVKSATYYLETAINSGSDDAKNNLEKLRAQQANIQYK